MKIDEIHIEDYLVSIRFGNKFKMHGLIGVNEKEILKKWSGNVKTIHRTLSCDNINRLS